MSAETAKAIKLPAAAARRRCRKKMAGKLKVQQGQQQQTHRAAVVIACRICSHEALRAYATLQAARDAISKPH